MFFHEAGRIHPRVPLLLTVPHSGERVPPEAAWLTNIPQEVLLTDVDRFVDRLYQRAAEALPLPLLATAIHRYAADLNRYPEDVDAGSVLGSKTPAGMFSWGFHWVETTQKHRLMPAPIAPELHAKIVARYHDAFHAEIERWLQKFRAAFPGRELYHLDCHSMPSRGTEGHADAGKPRPQVVISDFEGKSSGEPFRNAVLEEFRGEGFEVSYNWPYKGGRMTQRYGRPAQGHHTIQIELNRALYMDEGTRAPLAEFEFLSRRLESVLTRVVGRLTQLK